MNRFAARLIRVLEGLLAANLLAISVIVVAQVVLRYCFASAITGANEVITILFIYMSALGAAVAIGKREHIAITMATDSFPRQLRRLVDTLSIFAVAVLNAVMVAHSISWIGITGGYLMPTTELPRMVVQASVPLGCGLAALLCVTLLFDRPSADTDHPVSGGSGNPP